MKYGLTLGVLITATLSGRAAIAQSPPAFRAEYTVEVKDTAAHLFHVTATFRNVNQPSLQLSLPIWTPGWYTLEYYGKNVRRLSVTDGAGKRLAAPLLRAQTWSVDSRGTKTVVVEFDYFANILNHNQAKITDRFAFFTGTQLFLEPIGHRNTPSKVRFVTPTGWRIATALTETADPAVYGAADYDALVDSPTWLGAFSLIEFEVANKRHFVVFDSAAQFPPSSVRRYTEQLATLFRTVSAIFGELPYDKYGIFLLPASAEPGTGGALEHGNSSVSCCSLPTTLGVDQGYAHEFFHLWNVKRIRPAELWPYDYSRPVDTPSMWVSEGITSYYGAKTAYRSGLVTESEFLASLVQMITSYERNPERGFVSLSDASRSMWRKYPSAPISYYDGGNIAGALLDLSILRDSRGRRGLDDVMRVLFTQYYQRNRGFTSEALIRAVSTVAGRDYGDFFRRFIDGTDVPPYDSVFAYAGLRRTDRGEVLAILGMLSSVTAQGRHVDIVSTQPVAGAAAIAGLRAGDVLLAMDGVPVDRIRFESQGFAIAMQPRETRRVVFSVLRDTALIEVPFMLRPSSRPATRLEYDSTATAGQIAVRRAWLSRP